MRIDTERVEAQAPTRDVIVEVIVRLRAKCSEMMRCEKGSRGCLGDGEQVGR